MSKAERAATLRRSGLIASAEALERRAPREPEPRYHLVAYNTENHVRTQITRRPVKRATCERLRSRYKPTPTRRLVIEPA